MLALGDSTRRAAVGRWRSRGFGEVTVMTGRTHELYDVSPPIAADDE